MNGTVKEWVLKAEADFATAGRELQATANPNYDAVCFHAQQCVEKLMKALLIHLGVTPPKTHDLGALEALLTPVCPGVVVGCPRPPLPHPRLSGFQVSR